MSINGIRESNQQTDVIRSIYRLNANSSITSQKINTFLEYYNTMAQFYIENSSSLKNNKNRLIDNIRNINYKFLNAARYVFAYQHSLEINRELYLKAGNNYDDLKCLRNSIEMELLQERLDESF